VEISATSSCNLIFDCELGSSIFGSIELSVVEVIIQIYTSQDSNKTFLSKLIIMNETKAKEVHMPSFI